MQPAVELTANQQAAWELYCLENTHGFNSWRELPERVQDAYLLRVVLMFVDKALAACCPNERRDANGGCVNCGAPCF